MNRNNLPSNIRSIILDIDNELQDEFANKDVNDFIESIEALIDYYYPVLYKRVYKVDGNIEYKNKSSDFIYTLTTGIYQRLEMIKAHNNDDDEFFTKEYLYEEIIELVAKYVLNVYYDFLADYARTNNLPIWVFSNNDIDKIINDAQTFQFARQELDIFSTSVYVIDAFMDEVKISINKDLIITFYNLPRAIYNNIQKLLYNLSKYERFITKKNIYCVNEQLDNNTYLFCSKEKIDISQGYFNIYYNIIYLLLKDKLLKVYDEQYWRNAFANILSVQYIADGVTIIDQYLFHSRARIDHIEYFMSIIINFILNNEKVYVGDLIAYKHAKHILEELT